MIQKPVCSVFRNTDYKNINKILHTGRDYLYVCILPARRYIHTLCVNITIIDIYTTVYAQKKTQDYKPHKL